MGVCATSPSRRKLAYKAYFKTGSSCHPERGEGSAVPETTRFFAALRMTITACEALKYAPDNFTSRAEGETDAEAHPVSRVDTMPVGRTKRRPKNGFCAVWMPTPLAE
jgi:hypothetical protein